MIGLSGVASSAHHAKAAEFDSKKDVAVAKKTVDIEKTEGKQTVDIIKKVGESLDLKI